MEIPEENLTSLDFLLKNLSSMIYIPMNKLKETNDIIKKAKEKHEKELKEAYEKGVKYTDGIISDERFPF
jgi:glycerol-3-phosphate dehydrogenase